MKTKTWTVTATMETDLTTQINVPEHWTEEQVYEWCRNYGDDVVDAMQEDGIGAWTWSSMYESDCPDPSAYEVEEDES